MLYILHEHFTWSLSCTWHVYPLIFAWHLLNEPSVIFNNDIADRHEGGVLKDTCLLIAHPFLSGRKRGSRNGYSFSGESRGLVFWWWWGVSHHLVGNVTTQWGCRTFSPITFLLCFCPNSWIRTEPVSVLFEAFTNKCFPVDMLATLHKWGYLEGARYIRSVSRVHSRGTDMGRPLFLLFIILAGTYNFRILILKLTSMLCQPKTVIE